jgi:hypothetical protein
MVERGCPVDVALVLHGQARGVLPGGVAEVHVTRAVRDIDDRVVGERVALVGEVEDAALPGRAVVRVEAGRVEVASSGIEVASGFAGLRRPAGAAAFEVEDDLLCVRLVDPEAELRAVGALAVAAWGDALPPRG